VRALRHVAYGSPSDALELVDIAPPTPGPGEVRCKVLASPINPSDLLTLRGLYPIQLDLPRIPGIEGVGEVESIGSGVEDRAIGQRVLLPVRAGPWAELAVCRASECIALPGSVDPSQLSMLRINALTARVMLSELSPLSEGDWMIQNPGSSSVGQYTVQMARLMGIKTVNLIRRESREAHLKALGADVVLMDGPDLGRRVREATGGAQISMAFDGVGGAATDRLARCLQREGKVFCYGAVSRKAAELSVLQTVFRGISLHGFWLYSWKKANPERLEDMICGLVDDFEAGRLITEVAGVYSLERWSEALDHARSSERNGRVVFCPSGE
jgi:trans-2-enoyl-CoA reductase